MHKVLCCNHHTDRPTPKTISLVCKVKALLALCHWAWFGCAKSVPRVCCAMCFSCENQSIPESEGGLPSRLSNELCIVSRSHAQSGVCNVQTRITLDLHIIQDIVDRRGTHSILGLGLWNFPCDCCHQISVKSRFFCSWVLLTLQITLLMSASNVNTNWLRHPVDDGALVGAGSLWPPSSSHLSKVVSLSFWHFDECGESLDFLERIASHLSLSLSWGDNMRQFVRCFICAWAYAPT